MSADPGGDARGNGRRGAPPAAGPGAPPARHRSAGAAARAPARWRGPVARLAVVGGLAAALAGAIAVDAGRAGQAGTAGAREPRPGRAMVASPPAERGASTWYCAAGTAVDGGMADHSVTILNPTPRDLGAVVTVFPGALAGASPGAASGDPGVAPADPPGTGPAPAPAARSVHLPAGRQVSVRLADVVRAPLAAAVVEVDGGGVAVEHQVRGGQGVAAAPCATFTAPTWHLAAGSTARDARAVVALFNPFPSRATVDAVLTTPTGRREPVRLQGLPVPPRSVVGVDLGEDVTRSDQVSATFTVRSGRLVVERLQQFDGSLGSAGLSLTLGSPAPGDAWVFADGEASAAAPATPPPRAGGDAPDGGESGDAAEGSDGGAGAAAAGGDGAGDGSGGGAATSERIVVYNPGDRRAEVEVTVVPTAGRAAVVVTPFSLSVRAGGYAVLDYGEHDRIEPGVAHATIVRATGGLPVVVERVTADRAGAAPPAAGGPDAGRAGAVTAAPGARLAATGWAFPALTGTGSGTVTLALFNPDPGRSAEVRVTPVVPGPAGTHLSGRGERLVLGPGEQSVVAVGAGGGVPLLVAADLPVVAERTVRAGDGRRLVAGPGTPLAGGAGGTGGGAAVLAPGPGGQLVGPAHRP